MGASLEDRFWLLADIPALSGYVRSSPDSGHSSRGARRPLMATKRSSGSSDWRPLFPQQQTSGNALPLMGWSGRT